MATIKITLGNRYISGICEDFICHNVDIFDRDEVEYCVDECCGVFLDNNSNMVTAALRNISEDTLYEGFSYVIEEVFYDEL